MYSIKGEPVWIIVVEQKIFQGMWPVSRIIHKEESFMDRSSIDDFWRRMSIFVNEPGHIRQVMYFDRSIPIEEISQIQKTEFTAN